MTPPLARGTQLDILITAEGNTTPLRVRGTVVRTVAHDPDPDALSGCGVLLNERSRQALADLVERLGRQEPEAS